MIKRAIKAMLPESAYRTYRRLKVARQISTYTPRTVEHTYAGRRLRIALRDPLAEGWYDHDWPLPRELELASEAVDLDGAVVFDLGAHQGVVALILAGLVGDRGRVIAVEAERHNARVAVENTLLNGARNIVVKRAAVVDRAGEVLFVESLNGHVAPGSRAGKVRVPAVTIDGLADRFGAPARRSGAAPRSRSRHTSAAAWKRSAGQWPGLFSCSTIIVS